MLVWNKTGEHFSQALCSLKSYVLFTKCKSLKLKTLWYKREILTEKQNFSIFSRNKIFHKNLKSSQNPLKLLFKEG